MMRFNEHNSINLSKLLSVLLIVYWFVVMLIPLSYLNLTVNNIPVQYSIFLIFTSILCLFALVSRSEFTEFDRWLLFLLLGFCLSFITSVDKLFTFRSIFSISVKGFGIAFVASRIDGFSKNTFVKWIFVCLSLVCVLGICEYAGDVLFNTKLNPWAKYIIINSTQADGSIVYTGKYRVVSSIGHPNIIGAIIVLLLPLSVWFVQNTKGMFRYCSLFSSIAMLVLTFSRASYIAGIIAVLIYVIMSSDYKKAVLNICKLSLVIILLISILMLIPQTRQIVRGKFNASEMKIDIFESHRYGSYESAYNVFKKYPFFGVGYGNYSAVHRKYMGKKTDKYLKIMDNMYLKLIAEIGVTGLLFYLIFMLYWLKELFRNRGDLFVLAIAAGLTGFMINQITVELLSWAPVSFLSFMLLGIGIAQMRAKKQDNFCEYGTYYNNKSRA